jgi:ribosomal protein S18 acetylase RimI-like enzyme
MACSMPDRLPPIRMQRDLSEPIDAAVWPEGAQLHGFTTEHSAAVHELLNIAYLDGGGSVEAFSVWWSSLATDPEFDPSLIFVAREPGFRIIGIAHCWTSAFVKDLVVHPNWRRRGLGRALLLHAFGFFKHRGALTVSLKVQANNPSGAIRLYRALGMRQISD